MRRMGSAQRTRQRAVTKAKNSRRKALERDRRDKGAVEAIKAGSLPYMPWVMSWLNRELGKPTRQITQNDVHKLVSTRESAAPAHA